jgi:hypothetical protein
VNGSNYKEATESNESVDFFNTDFDKTIQDLDKITQREAVKIEINQGLEEALKELDSLKDQFSTEDSARLLDLCKNTVIETITSQFGLASLFIESKDGGSVTTSHNFEKGITSTDADRQKYNTMEANKQRDWQDVRKSTGYDDPLPGKRKVAFQQQDKIIDTYTGKELPKDGRAVLDHIVSAKEIESSPANNLFLTPEERAKIATSDKNLAWTESSANQSKGKKTMKEWLDTPDKQGGTKADKFGIDRDMALKEDAKARGYVKTQVTVAAAKKHGSELLTTGGKDAAKMAAYSALGVILRDLTQAVFEEIRTTFRERGKETLKEIFIRFKERIDAVITEIKTKWKDIFQGSIEAGITAFLSNIVVFVINLFATILKKLVSMIRAGFVSLCQAVKMLANPPAGMDREEANYQALKILTAGLIGAASLGLSAAIDTLLKSIPGLQPIMLFPIPLLNRTVSDVLSVTLSALAGGILTTVALYFMDKCRAAGRHDKLQIQLVTQSGVVVRYKIAQTWTVMGDGWDYFNNVVVDGVKTMIETKKAIDESHIEAADAVDDFHRLIENRRKRRNVEDAEFVVVE